MGWDADACKSPAKTGGRRRARATHPGQSRRSAPVARAHVLRAHALSASHFAATLGQPRSKEHVAMKNASPAPTGRHFLQIPGPTNVPDRVLQAIAMPTIDHRGPEFALLGQEIIAGMKRVFQT